MLTPFLYERAMCYLKKLHLKITIIIIMKPQGRNSLTVVDGPIESFTRTLAVRFMNQAVVEHIGHVARMSVSGYRGRQIEHRHHQYVVSLSTKLYL